MRNGAVDGVATIRRLGIFDSLRMEEKFDRLRQIVGIFRQWPLCLLLLPVIAIALSACSPELDSGSPFERRDAVRLLTDENQLSGIAISDEHEAVRIAAIERLLDLSATPESISISGWPISEALATSADVPSEHRIRIALYVADLLAALREARVQSLVGTYRLGVEYERRAGQFFFRSLNKTMTQEGEKVTITTWAPPARSGTQFSWASDFGLVLSYRGRQPVFAEAEINVTEVLSTILRDLDQSELVNMTQNNPNRNVRTAAARLVVDQSILAEVVLNADEHNSVRESAASSLIDQEILGQVFAIDGFGGEADYSVARVALQNVVNQNLLAELALNDGVSTFLRFDAIDRLTNRSVLAELAAAESSVGLAAQDRLSTLNSRRQ